MRAGGRVWRWWRRTWASYRGITPLVLLLVALVLGYLGYRAYFAAAGESRPWYDLVYFDLQLLTFNTRSVSDPTTTLRPSARKERTKASPVAPAPATTAWLRLNRARDWSNRSRNSRIIP
ncbi:MAG TPA: hypothetical protein VIT01_19465, partial [Acidimicrobiales bacterium]